ncbi:hypothetical protein JNM05_05355 [bacterium]|nr:hypothetical protein [bacterium]
MQYMQKGGYQQNPLTSLTLGFTIVLLVGFVVTNFIIFYTKMGITPNDVIAYYNGSEETFRPARTFGSMLEVTHGHLPVMAVVILMLTHLVTFFPLSKTRKIALIATPFLAALLDEGSGWLVRFAHPQFAWLKIGSFLVLQASLLFLLIALAHYLILARRETINKENEERNLPPASGNGVKTLEKSHTETIKDA